MGKRSGRTIQPKAGKAVADAGPLWQGLACELLKRALRDSGLGYLELSEGLRSHGFSMSSAALNRRINRGAFNGDFLLLCLRVIGVVAVRFDGAADADLDYAGEGQEPSNSALALEQILGFR